MSKPVPVESLIAQGKLSLAETELRRQLARSPGDAQLSLMMGRVLSVMGRRDEGLLFLRKAAEYSPESPKPWLALGITLCQCGRHAEAVEPLARAAGLSPAVPNVRVALARALVSCGRSAAAIAELESLLAILPGDPDATVMLASLLSDRGYAGAAVAALREAVARRHGDPGLRAALCHRLHYAAGVSAAHVAAEHEALGALLSEGRGKASFDNDRSPDRKLRVGLISPDFRALSIAAFFEPLVEKLDRATFEVHLFSLSSTRDAVSDRFRRLADVWHDAPETIARLGMIDSPTLVAQLADAKLDVALDLCGYSPGTGLGALAHRVAPVQAMYLGYPGTTGLRTIDLRFADDETIPPRESVSGTEFVVRLSPTLFCFRPPAEAPSPRRVWERRSVVFGHFGTTARISPDTVDLWSRILLAVPKSKLMLKSGPLADSVVREAFVAAFGSRGVASERLVLLGHTKDAASHLAAYNTIDVALDTSPYNGTTTTCEALWMGVPVVSLSGDRYASRCGASILGSIGHREWCKDTIEGCVEVACSLVADVESLAARREPLREKARLSPLCDEQRIATQVGHALREAWRRYCRTGAARP